MISKCAKAAIARVCLLALTLAVAAPAAAQKPTFDIEGLVTDAQQGVLPGATVTLQNVANGLSRETTTDANGRYVFTSLPPVRTVRAADLACGLRRRASRESELQRRPARGGQRDAQAVVACRKR